MTRRYDLQVHTDASPCSNATPQAVVEAAVNRGLDGIAVTNHDTLEGVSAVQAAAPSALRVIPGVEVTTSQGHLLALGVKTPPAPDDPLPVIERVHEQGGVAVLSHPFDRLREAYTTDLDAIAAAVDAVEATNSRCLLSWDNGRAQTFAQTHGLPRTGGSDAHFPMEIGRAHTAIDGDRPLLAAIRDGSTTALSPQGHGGYASGHVATKLHRLRISVDRTIGFATHREHER
ncbi:PHP domain-containing protein [Halocatena pleomorpha]|uniref:PHP domain-containing protein n=1 Tax=Halocatena pleomorpha TaxID=1785090 RepID=A0A3P3R5U5_9EURY|nr:PHP domain-containing protein [Halocatena pleomorpha]RRJ28861.1 PHP domain-containing protein [Halocatena pleomorpha]